MEHWCSKCKREFSENNIEHLKQKVEPIVIPLTATEDRLIGSIDVKKLLKSGEKSFVPGILVKANRKILYIDEVNLLPDFLTDSILDVSATGYNTVEREGFSFTHQSEFLLVGTMNPEEGELRPQILDRFPISVEINPIINPKLRKEIIQRNLLFKQNKKMFRKQFDSKNNKLKKTLTSIK